jgi:hypothetical protein
MGDRHTPSSTKAKHKLKTDGVIHILNSTCLLYLKIPVEAHNKLLLLPGIREYSTVNC